MREATRRCEETLRILSAKRQQGCLHVESPLTDGVFPTSTENDGAAATRVAEQNPTKGRRVVLQAVWAREHRERNRSVSTLFTAGLLFGTNGVTNNFSA